MAKHNQGSRAGTRRWLRRVGIALAVCFALLVIFHRPLLQLLVKEVFRYYASKQNLKITFAIEGNIFSNLTLRNVHAGPKGPTDVESIDADVMHLDYSLWDLIRHGISEFLKNIQVRSARVVLNPANAPPKSTQKPKKMTLPISVFPDQLKLSDVSVVIRDKPHDFFLQNIDLDLDPRLPGKAHIGRLQLPDGQTWANLSASTSYSNKNLVIRDLKLNDLDRISMLNVDASQISNQHLDINIESQIGGGKISGKMNWLKKDSSLSNKVELHARDVSAEALNKYTNLPESFLGGNIASVDVDLTGKVNSPNTWDGTLAADLRDFHLGALQFENGEVRAHAKHGQAVIESAQIIQADNHIKVDGWMKLPEKMEQLGRTPADLEVSANALDLDRFTAGSPHPLSGSAQLNGKLQIKDDRLVINVVASAKSVGFHDGTIDEITATVRASKILPPRNQEKPWFADVRAAMNVNASGTRYDDYIFDSIDGSMGVADGVLTIQRLELDRQQNNLTVTGQYHLPESIRNLTDSAVNLSIALNANNVGDYWVSDSPDKITGPLQMTAQIGWKNRVANGRVSMVGSNLETRDLIFTQLNAQASISDNTLQVTDLTARLNETDFVAASGTLDLRPPFRYNGKLAANVSDVSTLEPALHAFGNESEVAGSLQINWEGSGLAAKFQDSGKLKLRFANGRYGDLESIQARIDAAYSPEGLEMPLFFLSTNRMNFQTIVEAKGQTLEINKIELNQGESKYASGYISIPFVWKNLGTAAPVMPTNGKVTATFQSENIDIKKVFEDLGTTAPASGTLNVKLDASGTLSDLNARLDLQIRDLQTEKAPKLEPATVDLTAQIQDDQLNVTGKLEQKQIEPLQLTANLPIDISRTVRQRKLPADTPVTAKIRLPRSSVNFLREIVPDLEVLDGDLAMDVDVGGTVGQPVLSGNADMTVNLARFSNATLPALRDFKARLIFAKDNLTLERFNGELAGGHFTAGGNIKFLSLTSINLDLRLKADSVLVARNDTMTIRTDADLAVAGPLTSATVTGNVALTNSSFLKNIDLIPIGLPGRPPPQPPPAEPEFSFTQPPFRDWKFDIAVKTKDPVLIRGNLAAGRAIVDLKLAGTGLHPGLSGVVRLNNVDATLPFSRLSVSQGFLYFDPSDSFNPKVDLRGTSIIQDYTVRVYVYGTILSPEAVFTSEPPLAQEEIISLLATGATREQLTGSNDVLAGRAAMLLVQQLYRKLFKKGESTQSNTVFDRLDLSVGQIDPRTGQRQATARFKVNNQFLVVGDLEVGGDFRLKVRYLLRFR